MNDSIINKLASIDRYLDRIREVYALAKENFDSDYTSQDSIFKIHRLRNHATHRGIEGFNVRVDSHFSAAVCFVSAAQWLRSSI